MHFFCDQINCSELFEQKMKNPFCAFYNPGNLKADYLVVDEQYPLDNAVIEYGPGLMHNKFCISGNFVWTGSWNPNQEMNTPNNVIILESKTLAEAYKKEFDELYSGVFHRGKSSPGLVKLNNNLIEAYFCPEDNCQQNVLSTLNKAKKSIHFMTYSFTDDKIGDLLLGKNVEIKGIFDPRKNKYSEYEKLKEFSIIKKVHHKVFIIDNEIVITGSYNPSKNANTRNDENVLIIHDKKIAEKFELEFERLFN